MNTIKSVKYQKLLIAVFLIILVTPNLFLMFDYESSQLKDKNKAKRFPSLNLSKPLAFIAKAKSYYLDNYGLKAEAINTYYNFKSSFLNENPMPNNVVNGKNGWYFLGNRYNNVFNNSFGIDKFKKGEVETIARRILSVKNYLKSKGIKFYLVIPPDKHTIYHENLPIEIDESPKKLDVLKKYLKEKINFDLIDLSTELFKHKDSLLYFKTNSHWTDYGAYLGYKEIVKHINKDFNVEVENLKDYKYYKDLMNGDVINMINITDNEMTTFLKKKEPTQLEIIAREKLYYHFKNPNKKLKILFYRDSFTNAMIPFFNETFGETMYRRFYNLEKDFIKKQQPDIVIFELIERNINSLAKTKPLE